MRDGLHEVCFPNTARSVDKERIVDASWSLGDGERRCCSNLIRFSNNELVECVACRKNGWRVNAKLSRGSLWLNRGASLGEQIHLRSLLSSLVREKNDMTWMPQYHGGDRVEECTELGLVPVRGELIRNSNREFVLCKCNRHSRFEPCTERLFRHVSFHIVEQSLPGLVGREIHDDVEKIGRPNVGTVCGKVNSSRKQATANPLTYKA